MKRLTIKNSSTEGEIVTITLDYDETICLEPGEATFVAQVERVGGETPVSVWPQINVATFKLSEFVTDSNRESKYLRRLIGKLEKDR